MKRPLSFCQKCRWQVTAKQHTHPTYVALNKVTLKTGALLNGVRRSSTETAAFHVAPAMQETKERYQYTILIIRAMKGYSHSFRITCDMCTVSLLESREQRYIKIRYKNKKATNKSEYTVTLKQNQSKMYTT